MTVTRDEVDDVIQHRLKAVLEPGEQVLWTGYHKIAFGRVARWLEVSVACILGLSILFSLVILIGSWATDRLPNSPWLAGAVIVLQCIVAVMFLRGAGRASPRQLLFLTNKRFGLLGWFPLLTIQGRRRDLPVDAILSVDAIVWRRASGDLVFSHQRRSWPSNTCTIYDVDNVEDVARKLAKAAGIEPHIRKSARPS